MLSADHLSGETAEGRAHTGCAPVEARAYNGWVTADDGTRAGEDRAARACAETAEALRRAGVEPEALAELVPAGRRLLVLPRPATMRPIGEVWRLGSLLLDAEGGLWAAGRATRAAERGRPGYQSASREDRRDLAAAALHGGYPAGSPVNFDAQRLPLDTASVLALGDDAPIGIAAGDAERAANAGGLPEIRVRWRAGAPIDGAPTLEQYLRERAALLIDPPLGAD